MKAFFLRLLPLSASLAVIFAANAIAIDEVDISHQRKVCNQINNAARPMPSDINPLADDDKAKSGQTAEGVFTGIEQGDYAHFKLRESDGTERSFFILQTDAAIERVLADPQEYEGRNCRVRWERRSENIPEAGGPMEIDVLLGVDWQ